MNSPAKTLTALLCLFLATTNLRASEPPNYARDIQPLFTKYCTACHNDDDAEGKLSLDSYASLLKGGEKGSVVTPERGDLSRIVRVLTGQAKPAMPPKDNDAPTADEVALLKAWIDAGAKGPSGAAAAMTLVTPKIPLTAQTKPAVHALALSPDGQIVALARHGEVELQKIPERTTLRTLAGHSGSVNHVSFSRDGQYLVAAAGEPGLFGEARLWKVADGSLVKTFRGHKDSLYAARLSPDGQTLATGGYDSAIKLWRVADGQELRTLDGHNGAVFDLAFRADGKILASASGDRTVKLWSVATGERLDTLKESLQELYAVEFSPTGDRVAAAGVDNRIRVWQVSPDAKEGTNPLLISKFAHERPILRLTWSRDGKTLVSAGEDRLVKVWNAPTMTIRETLEPQSDWASGLALLPDGDKLIVGRIDGTTGAYNLAAATSDTEAPLVPLPEVPPEVDYGPQPSIDELAKVEEAEPNDDPLHANAISIPGTATGRIFAEQVRGDVDLFRFDAKEGEQWIVEIEAARKGSPLDSKIEILAVDGQPVPRLLLRAVRDTEIEFRGMNSEQRGVRLKHWEELLLNQYIYLNGEVLKHYQQRRGPDADGNMYPENGNRFSYFETTSRAHALGEPGYIVVPYAVGTVLPNNGLPVFTQYFENDDQSQRQLGKDSRVTFVAPKTGTYLARVSDVRGFSGDTFSYRLIVRRPQLDFKVTLGGANPTVNKGSGKPFTLKAERLDNFNGPIQVEITGAPPGIQITSPITIAEGLYEAQGVVSALPSTNPPTDEDLAKIKITATATIAGRPVTHDVNGLGKIKLADKPKVLVYLELSAEGEPASGAPPEDAATLFPAPAELVIHPGDTVACKLRVERNGFDDRISFDVQNLPHGVIVDDIGLNGILIPEGKTERTMFLRAEGWVPEQTRLFHAVAQVDGNQVSLPLRIRVAPK